MKLIIIKFKCECSFCIFLTDSFGVINQTGKKKWKHSYGRVEQNYENKCSSQKSLNYKQQLTTKNRPKQRAAQSQFEMNVAVSNPDFSRNAPEKKRNLPSYSQDDLSVPIPDFLESLLSKTKIRLSPKLVHNS